jgi:16S rRNA (cytosine1402-N4)-methyltransferase
MDLLAIESGDIVIDGTFGGGGHSMQIAQALDPDKGKLFCVDIDESALTAGVSTLSPYREKGLDIQFVHTSFSEIATKSEFQGVSPNKILLDLGWSSDQFADSERGFSFQLDGPLDMRLDRDPEKQTAKELLESISEADLVDILQTFGEETRARSVAKSIKQAVVGKKMNTTRDLSDAVLRVIPRSGPTHPATKTFQAIRIAVNHEISALTEGIPELVRMLAVGGRLAVITFHSIEDRIVKQLFESERQEGNCELVNKKVIIPSNRELEKNPRARSAKLRCIQRI